MPGSSAGDDSTSASTGRDQSARGAASISATKRAAISPPMLWPSSTSGPRRLAAQGVDHPRQVVEQVVGLRESRRARRPLAPWPRWS